MTTDNVNKNITRINKIKGVTDNLFEATVLLDRAGGIVDLLFTVSANNKIDELCRGTLTKSLDAVYFLIAEAGELVVSETESSHV